MKCPACGHDLDQLVPVEPTAAKDWGAARWGSVEALAFLFNVQTPNNVPAVEVLSPKRREKARRALKVLTEKRDWERVFEEWRKSNFLSGRVAPTNGHSRWSPSFDWMLGTSKNGVENYVAIYDGSYSA